MALPSVHTDIGLRNVAFFGVPCHSQPPVLEILYHGHLLVGGDGHLLFVLACRRRNRGETHVKVRLTQMCIIRLQIITHEQRVKVDTDCCYSSGMWRESSS